MTASNRAIVMELFQELDNHDLATIMDLCSDCVYHAPSVGEIRGEALRQFFASVLRAFPDVQRTVMDQFSDDIHVVTRWTYTGTHKGPFRGIAPTGKRVTITGISIHRVADGRIAEEWQEWDSLGLMEQLGVIPTFKSPDVAA